ncbi:MULTISPECIES: efflux transporter outer membrane subunit [unclassified Acinetobacter]|uniref:efflux transporter outer membrane subunit n=1 Tax=unclassified Acinetobacter TaxID=196816 RepID=UPI002934E1B0|nr:MULTISPECIES: efflux transporter outer membrane subunit [unclassified Acinetobacter]WOE31513.1 efflux transporter outer membrane subunit [Acinetobacter sp. SAAs470]WOE39709.1 efflux transporter outer membrane subunit [Acinetobacter sp. SAAs474]
MRSLIYKNLVSLSCIFILTACSSNAVRYPVAYSAPIIETDDRYQYADLNWTATSVIKISAEQWWHIYQDPILSQLIQQLNQENLTLQQAEARYQQAQALLDIQRAHRFPNITVNTAANRNGAKHSSINNQFGSAIQASWIPDLWGRVAKAIEGQQANLAANHADLDAVKLNQQLLAIEAYWNIRVLDAQFDLLQHTENSYLRFVQILNNQYTAGMIARADVIQAEAQLKQVQIQLVESVRARNLQQNILAVLQGKSVAQFQLVKQKQTFIVPYVPTQLPSRLLIQRPDVIRAERELAITHAELGLAQTAWLPDVTIGLNGSLNSQILSTLFQSPQYLWSTGLQAVALVFDGGKRRAEVAQAQASYAEKLAAYKQSILIGWKDVEDALLQVASFQQQHTEQEKLFALAIENEQVANQRYQAGLVTYLEVVTAQNLRLQVEQDQLQLKLSQLKNTAQLIAALGGKVK